MEHSGGRVKFKTWAGGGCARLPSMPSPRKGGVGHLGQLAISLTTSRPGPPLSPSLSLAALGCARPPAASLVPRATAPVPTTMERPRLCRLYRA